MECNFVWQMSSCINSANFCSSVIALFACLHSLAFAQLGIYTLQHPENAWFYSLLRFNSQ